MTPDLAELRFNELDKRIRTKGAADSTTKRGKADKFSLDKLVEMSIRMGGKLKLTLGLKGQVA